ncbi:hypothetical protein CN895_07645 [Bacillus cereus]|uniref:hypothetical protein n=1 Tax=Bacillus cereus TaxID=1396 RepID=UPI000BFBEC3F|nr:hypothetical protein [Bacillus cereus]PGK15214.1 hypothetical protein CN895_07645 [Bacillus cereus]
MFYTVTANFRMRCGGHLEVQNFLDLGKAIEFAEEQKIEFLNEIPNGALDEDETMSIDYSNSVNGQHYYFYGVSKDEIDEQNYVTIRVVESKFQDRPEAKILVED